MVRFAGLRSASTPANAPMVSGVPRRRAGVSGGGEAEEHQADGIVHELELRQERKKRQEDAEDRGPVAWTCVTEEKRGEARHEQRMKPVHHEYEARGQDDEDGRVAEEFDEEREEHRVDGRDMRGRPGGERSVRITEGAGFGERAGDVEDFVSRAEMRGGVETRHGEESSCKEKE